MAVQAMWLKHVERNVLLTALPLAGTLAIHRRRPYIVPRPGRALIGHGGTEALFYDSAIFALGQSSPLDPHLRLSPETAQWRNARTPGQPLRVIQYRAPIYGIRSPWRRRGCPKTADKRAIIDDWPSTVDGVA
ncbi:hypothetical protein C8Q79DRAFT_758038 [Trametes meyenii]|nr:hypothetical protein C8Q79DRAFT_758038 [Trametes meyenii]